MLSLRHLFLPHHTNNQKPKILHLGSFIVLIALFVTFQATTSLLSQLYPHILGFASQIPPESIIELTNQQRTAAGIPPVTYNAQLSDAARRKAADMFARDYWAHNAPDGTKPWSFIQDSGYRYLHAGENLARDFANPDTVVAAWMASPTHRDNLLNSRYQDIGIAVVDGQLNGSETTLVVQMFGTPQSAAPSLAAGDTTSLIAPVLAQETTPPAPLTPTLAPQQTSLHQPLFSSFTTSKIITLAFALLILLVLSLDWYVAWKRNLIRLSGKNWAHITFIVTVILLSIIIKQGLII